MKCPHCQNANLETLQYREVLPSYRTLRRLEGGRLKVSLESAEDYEDADNAEIFCTECGNPFPVPGDLVVDFED